ARDPRLVPDLRAGPGQRARRRARPDGGRVVAAGSRARERVALPDPAPPHVPVGRSVRRGGGGGGGAAARAHGRGGGVGGSLRRHGDPVEAPINAFFWRNVARVSAEGDEVLVELHEPSAG